MPAKNNPRHPDTLARPIVKCADEFIFGDEAGNKALVCYCELSLKHLSPHQTTGRLYGRWFFIQWQNPAMPPHQT